MLPCSLTVTPASVRQQIGDTVNVEVLLHHPSNLPKKDQDKQKWKGEHVSQLTKRSDKSKPSGTVVLETEAWNNTAVAESHDISPPASRRLTVQTRRRGIYSLLKQQREGNQKNKPTSSL